LGQKKRQDKVRKNIMAKTYLSPLPIEESSGSRGMIGPGAKVAFSWVRAFWILAFVVVGGATAFQDAVVASIASTPHPEIVYIIFAVAGVAAFMLGLALYDFLKEQTWFDILRSSTPEEQDRMIAALPRTGSMAYFYRVYMQTRGMPLAIRQPAMEDEMHGVEAQMLGPICFRAALWALVLSERLSVCCKRWTNYPACLRRWAAVREAIPVPCSRP
jgi:hypothetical protein